MRVDSSNKMRNLSLFHSVLHGSSKMGSLGSPRKVRSEESCSVPKPLQGTLLNFENTKLEADYRAEWAAESYSADCGLYMLSFSLWILIWHTLYSAVDQRSLWAAANALMCACTLTGMRWQPEYYQKHRTMIISATKLIATAFATEIMLLPGLPTENWLGFLSAMGVLSKVSMLLFTACFMQIPFREHLLVQGIQVGYCILHNGRMCSALEGRYLGIRARCLHLADMLSALSYEAQAPLKVRPTSLGRERACESVNAYMQILFGYALSMLLLHELESRSRNFFLRKRWRAVQRAPWSPAGAPGSCLGALAIPAFLLLSAVIAWELVEGFWELRDAAGARILSL